MWSDLLFHLDDESRRGVEELMIERSLKSNDVLFWEGQKGDAMYVIDRGHILVERVTEEGDTVAVAILGPDSIVGEQALVGDDARGATARAVEATTVRSLSRGPFTDLRHRHASVDALLISMLDQRIRELNNLVLEARHIAADERVRRRLAEMHDLFGTEIPLTQSTLAALAGTTRPTANGVLQLFQDEGIIELKRGRVVVHEPNGLG